jgi:FOG: HEAT repeat
VSGGTAAAQTGETPSAVVARAWALLDRYLDKGSVWEQGVAVIALAGVGTPEAMVRVDRVAQSASPTRATALRSLAWSGRAEYLPAIASAIADPDRSVRIEAIAGLNAIRDPAVLPLLQHALASDDSETVERAGGAAGTLGALAFPLMLDVLDTGNRHARAHVALALSARLDPSLRPDAAESLDALRRLHPERILRQTLQDSESWASTNAALMLARLGDPAAVPVLRAVAAGSDRNGRYLAMGALNALGVAGYLSALVDLLHSADSDASAGAMRGLQSFPTATVREVLLRAWLEPGPLAVRAPAFAGLTARVTPADERMLRAGLRDPETAIRITAARKLLSLFPSDTESVGALEAVVLTDPVWPNLLVDEIATAAPERGAAILQRLWPESNEAAAKTFNGGGLSLIYVAGKLGDRQFIPKLEALLGAEQNVDEFVVNALLALGGPDVAGILVRAMDSPYSAARIKTAAGVIRLYSGNSPH